MAKRNCRWECPNQWSEWSQWLSAGLHARNRWRLPVLLVGILFANGRRTVTSWLRAAGISDDFDDYYYFLARRWTQDQFDCYSIGGIGSANLAFAEATCCWSSTILPPSDMGRKSREPTSIAIPHRGRPIKHICMVTSGSRFRLPIRHPKWGAMALPLRPCSTCAKRPCPRSLLGVIGGSLPSSNWQRVWSSGSFPS